MIHQTFIPLAVYGPKLTEINFSIESLHCRYVKLLVKLSVCYSTTSPMPWARCVTTGNGAGRPKTETAVALALIRRHKGDERRGGDLMQSDTTHEQAFTSGMQSRRLKLATGLGQAGEPMATILRLLVIDKLHAVIYLPPRSKMTFTSVLSSFCFPKLNYSTAPFLCIFISSMLVRHQNYQLIAASSKI